MTQNTTCTAHKEEPFQTQAHTLRLVAAHEISSEVLRVALGFIDGSPIYPPRHSNGYPRNQTCSARGTFHGQNLYKPNLYKWASFVRRMQLLN